MVTTLCRHKRMKQAAHISLLASSLSKNTPPIVDTPPSPKPESSYGTRKRHREEDEEENTVGKSSTNDIPPLKRRKKIEQGASKVTSRLSPGDGDPSTKKTRQIACTMKAVKQLVKMLEDDQQQIQFQIVCRKRASIPNLHRLSSTSPIRSIPPQSECLVDQLRQPFPRMASEVLENMAAHCNNNLKDTTAMMYNLEHEVLDSTVEPNHVDAKGLHEQTNPPEDATKPHTTKVRTIPICTHRIPPFNQDGQIEMMEIDSSNSLDVLSYPRKNYDFCDISCGSSYSLKRKRGNQDLSCPLLFEDLTYPPIKRQKFSEYDVAHLDNRSSQAKSWQDSCSDLNKRDYEESLGENQPASLKVDINFFSCNKKSCGTTDPLVELQGITNSLDGDWKNSLNMDFSIANTSDTFFVDYNVVVKDDQLHMESTSVGHGITYGIRYQLELLESTIARGFPFDPGIEENSRKIYKDRCFTWLRRTWSRFWMLYPLKFEGKGDIRDHLVGDTDSEYCKIMFCSCQWRMLWKFFLFIFKNQGNIRVYLRNGNIICSLFSYPRIDSTYNHISVSSFYNIGIRIMMEFLLFDFISKNSLSSRFLIGNEKIFTLDIDQEKLEFLFCSCQNFTSIWFLYSLSCQPIVDNAKRSTSDIDQENHEFLFCSCYHSISNFLSSLIHQVRFLHYSILGTQSDYKDGLIFVIASFTSCFRFVRSLHLSSRTSLHIPTGWRFSFTVFSLGFYIYVVCFVKLHVLEFVLANEAWLYV